MTRQPKRQRGRTGAPRNGRMIRYAVVGMGHIAQAAVLPAFAHARRTGVALVALVSGAIHKRKRLGRRYQVPTFDYSELEECLSTQQVDAAYIALPNDLHLEYVERCARAGVHVLCEKPLGLSEEECRRMVRACAQAEVQLMTAYRLHFEPANLEAKKAARKLGRLKLFSSDFSYQVKPGNIRTQRERGGGPLLDIGIYCLNAARNLFEAEPEEVFAYAARPKDRRFAEVDEAVSAVLRFPEGRLATFNCSFGAAPTATYRLVGERGDLCLEGAYEYVGARELTVTVDERSRTRTFPPVDQFAPELIHFAECLRDGRPVQPSGREGLADVRVLEALRRSVESGHPVRLAPIDKEERVRPDAAQRVQPVSKPPIVEVEAPSQ